MKRLCTAILLALVVSLTTTVSSLASEVPVCSMPRDEFVAAAFPDNAVTKLHGGKLLKYAGQPSLVVIAPKVRSMLGEDIERAFDQISGDGLVKPFRSSIETYETFEDALKIVQKFGDGNIFVLVAAKPNEPSEATNFRSALLQMLHRQAEVEPLIARSEVGKGFVSRNYMNVSTGEVISTAVIINPKYDDAQIGMMTYIAYYMSLSPSASSVEGYFANFFSKPSQTSAVLNEFARHFFQVFADDRVKFGMTEQSFIECPK